MFRSSVAAFYPWLVCLFYGSARSVRWNTFLVFRLLLCVRSKVEKIVHWMPEILFAAEIVFRRLDGDMPQQELDLLQLSTIVVAQLRTGSSQIMRCDVL
jgi:hypothetical protein